jgi:MtN3 and saliva related transmembrane protein
MNAITVLGLVAAAFTTASFVPQVVKTWRSGSSADLSLGMYSLFTVGIVLWLVYGVLIRDLPIILANVITLLLVLTVLGQALWHRRPRSID